VNWEPQILYVSERRLPNITDLEPYGLYHLALFEKAK